MALYKSDISIENKIDKESDLVMYEKRVVRTKIFGISFGSYSFERTTFPYEGEPVVKQNKLGFSK